MGHVGQRSLIITRKSTSYNIKLSIYNDGMRPVEMKRRLEVEEKLVCTVFDFAIKLIWQHFTLVDKQISLIYFHL